MATPQNVSKLDMSLGKFLLPCPVTPLFSCSSVDEIIKMNKKIQHKEKQKGPARAQGGGKGGQKGEGAGKSSGNDQPKLKPTAKKVRQNVKRTPQNSSSGSQGTKNKRRSGNALKNRQRPSQSGAPSTGIKSRLGMKKVTTTKGKSVVKQIFTSHGLNRGGKNDGAKGQRPGSRIQIIR